MSAKSRLTASRITELTRSLAESNQTPEDRKNVKTRLTTTRTHRSGMTHQANNPVHRLLLARVRRLYLLLIAAPGYIAVYYMLGTLDPNQVAHIVVPYGFLPLQVAMFWGNFFTFAWSTLRSTLGFRIAVYFSIVLALKLQAIPLSYFFVLYLLIIFGSVEYTIAFYSSVRKKTRY